MKMTYESINVGNLTATNVLLDKAPSLILKKYSNGRLITAERHSKYAAIACRCCETIDLERFCDKAKEM